MNFPLISRRAALASGLASGMMLALGGSARATESLTYLMSEDGRDVRVSIFPPTGPKRGIILFSHGFASNPEKYHRIIGPWNEAGFEVLAPLHTDSTDYPDHGKFGLKDGFRSRLLDMRALSAFVNTQSYVAAGHSYGGLIALTLGGAEADVPPGIKAPLRDRRATSVLALSPPGVTPGLITREGYAKLAVPSLIQSGTKDVPYGSKDGRWQIHLDAFDAAPAGDKYALVLDGADHYLGGLICEYDRPGPTQDAQLVQDVALSTMFMEAYGAHDAEAKERLGQALSDTTGLARLSRK